MRAQTELPALGVAFLLLTSVAVLGVSLADHRFTAAERDALERQTATSLSEEVVTADGPLTRRENVLDADAVTELNAKTLHERYGLPTEAGARIRLDGETIVATGDPAGGTTVERIVLVERRTERTIQPEFDSSRTVNLPRRTSNVRLTIDPPSGTRVRSVRVNGRVLLANESGLAGTFEVSITPLETARLRFETVGPLTAGSVQIEYAAPETRKALLAVTVDA